MHNDAHPANVLVRPQADYWDLAAWIDWEFAWVGDADWDLTRFDFIGTAQVGEIPREFWSGYGRKPDPVRHAAYELFFIVWLAGTRPMKRPILAPELAPVNVSVIWVCCSTSSLRPPITGFPSRDLSPDPMSLGQPQPRSAAAVSFSSSAAVRRRRSITESSRPPRSSRRR